MISQPTTGPGIVVFVTPPPKSLAVNASATFLAETEYPEAQSGSAPDPRVSLLVSCGSPTTCGSVYGSTDLPFPGSQSYSAPAQVPSGGTVTITASSIVDPTKSASATVTITPAVSNPAHL